MKRTVVQTGDGFDKEALVVFDTAFKAACYSGKFSMLQWAAAAGVHYNTLDRLVTRQTRYPRWQTVVALAKAVGLTVTFTAKQQASRRRSRRAA